MNSLNPQHKRILVIDGGGFRGLGCLLVIDHITKAASARARKVLRPCDIFDLICGTSTGGLLAILLGRLRLDIGTATEIYKQLSTPLVGVSEPNFWETILSQELVASSGYEKAIADVIAEHSGSSELSLIVDAESSDPGPQANVFVTMTSDAPDFTNRTHYLRSYPSPKLGVVSQPAKHQWLVREAIRATSASPLYMSPLIVENEYGFRDSGYSGFNNPVELAVLESERLWPGEKVGLIVSLGTDVISLTPINVGEDWTASDRYATKFLKGVLTKLGPNANINDRIRKRALDCIKQIANVAADTQLSHRSAKSKHPESIYYRLDPSLGLDGFDLFDIFHTATVEQNVQQWLGSPESEKKVTSIVERAVLLNTEPLSKDTARFVEPPRPSAEMVNPGYNPQLDKRRPETMIDYLHNYQVLFVIDDSSSMKGDRWMETRDALIGIADYALKYNTDHVNIRFLNSQRTFSQIKGASIIMSIFDEIQPRGYTPTGAILERILREHVSKLDNAVNTKEYELIRPLDIIVLTDGIPSDQPKLVLAEAVKKMRASKHHPNCIGVQFVQIANDDGADIALQDLIYGDNGSMVDTVPFDGELTAERLERILLGGLHPNVRAMMPIRQ